MIHHHRQTDGQSDRRLAMSRPCFERGKNGIFSG